MAENENRRVTVGTDLIRREHQVLPCKLTPDEIRDRGEQIAQAKGKLEELEAEEKTFKAEMKARREPLEQLLSQVSSTIRAGIEHRGVEVEVRADFITNRVDEIRSDTGEVIRSRPVRPDERQTVFAITGKSEA